MISGDRSVSFLGPASRRRGPTCVSSRPASLRSLLPMRSTSCFFSRPTKESGWSLKWLAELRESGLLMMSPFVVGDIQKPGTNRPDRFVAPPWRSRISRVEREGTLLSPRRLPGSVTRASLDVACFCLGSFVSESVLPPASTSLSSRCDRSGHGFLTLLRIRMASGQSEAKWAGPLGTMPSVWSKSALANAIIALASGFRR